MRLIYPLVNKSGLMCVLFHVIHWKPEVYSKRYKREEDQALPESIIKGLYFQNSQSHFDLALSKGDIVEVESDVPGKKFFAFRTYTIGKEDGKNQTHDSSSSKKLTAEANESLRDVFKKLNWSFAFVENQPVMDKNGRFTKEMEALLKTAQQAQEKMSKDIKSTMNGWKGSSETLKELKAAYAALISSAAQLAHLQELHEYQDGTAITKDNFHKFMLECAQKTQGYNVALQRAKGELKARNS